MGLTGLFLVSFLFVHLSGNLQLFYNDGGKAFNIYSHFMSTAGIIRVLELVLVVGFVLHIYTSWVITQHNAGARPIPYAHKTATKVSWFSKNMGLSGSIVLVFLIIHLWNFYWPYHYSTPFPMVDIDGEQQKDMYLLVATVFKNEWWYSILYVLAMVLLGFHLNHGFQSAFRTFGLDHKKYTPLVVGLGQILSIVIPAMFASMPLYFLLK
jgi:succinate dehydrogenase / fumarate reductase cytochrome b subunit